MTEQYMNENTEETQEAALEAEQPPHWDDGVENASFRTRFGAFLVDFIVLMMPLYSVIEPLSRAFRATPPPTREDLQALVREHGPQQAYALLAQSELPAIIIGNIFFAIACGAAWLLCWYYYAATPGKLLFRLKIVDGTTGMPASLRQNIIRFFGMIISGVPMALGFLWLVFDRQRRAWHDLIADTRVVKKATLPVELRDITLHSLKQR